VLAGEKNGVDEGLRAGFVIGSRASHDRLAVGQGPHRGGRRRATSRSQPMCRDREAMLRAFREKERRWLLTIWSTTQVESRQTARWTCPRRRVAPSRRHQSRRRLLLRRRSGAPHARAGRPGAIVNMPIRDRTGVSKGSAPYCGCERRALDQLTKAIGSRSRIGGVGSTP